MLRRGDPGGGGHQHSEFRVFVIPFAAEAFGHCASTALNMMRITWLYFFIPSTVLSMVKHPFRRTGGV